MARKKKDTWEHSKGRKLLRNDIRAGIVVEGTPWQTVFRRRPEFAFGKEEAKAKRLFEGRLEAAFECVKRKRERAAAELVLHEQDRLVCPKQETMCSGEPRWEGSAAQAFLKRDVAEGKHETMTPKEFFLSRAEHKC